MEAKSINEIVEMAESLFNFIKSREVDHFEFLVLQKPPHKKRLRISTIISGLNFQRKMQTLFRTRH